MRHIVSVLTLAVFAGTLPAQGLTVDKDKKAVIITAKVAPRKLADPKFEGKIYPVEVVASWAYPKGQKAHETVLTFDVKPSEIHKALESIGLKPGKPVYGDTDEKASGPELKLYVEATVDGDTRKIPIERTMLDPRTGKAIKNLKWIFTGSVMSKVAADKDEMAYGADLTGTLIAIFPVTNQTVIQTNLTMKEEKYLKIETNEKVLPKVGTDVKLIIEAAK
jgi:hypothetical protein